MVPTIDSFAALPKTVIKIIVNENGAVIGDIFSLYASIAISCILGLSSVQMYIIDNL